MPIGFFPPEVILNDKVSFIGSGSLWVFGVLCSRAFNVWNKGISGRTRNDTLISNTITYNNYPFPQLDETGMSKVVAAAQTVLDARSKYPDNSLADLYNKNGMPGELRQAHNALDALILGSYGLKATATDEQILTALFAQYDDLTRGLLDAQPVKKTRKKPEILA